MIAEGGCILSKKTKNINPTYTLRHHCTTLHRAWCPDSVSRTLNLKRLRILRNRILLLRIVATRSFNDIANRTGIYEAALKRVPGFRISIFLLKQVNTTNYSPVGEWWDILLVTNNS